MGIVRSIPPTLTGLCSIILLSLSLVGCTTIENRRDLYFPQRVWGPYTKMYWNGIPSTTSTQVIIKRSSSDGKSVVKPQGS